VVLWVKFMYKKRACVITTEKGELKWNKKKQ